MKKIMAVIVVLILAMNISVSAATGKNQPVLKISAVNYEQLESNESYELTITLANIGSAYGEDASLALIVPEETPVTVDQQILYQNIPYLNPDVAIDITYTIVVDSGAIAGTYKLGLEGIYYDNDNTMNEYEEYFSIEIIEGENDAIISSNIIDSTIIAGERNTIVVDLTNDGKGHAWSVSPSLVDSESLYQIEGEDHYLSTLESGQSHPFSFDIEVDELARGLTPLEIDVTYLTANGQVTKTLSTFINIEEEAEGSIVIGQVTKSKSMIYPEGQVTFDVEVVNVGDRVMEEIKIEVSQDEALVPVSQSIIMLNELSGGQSELVSFTMQATDSASTQNYPVTFKLTYDDMVINQYSGVNISNDEEDEEEDEEVVTKPRIILSNLVTTIDKIFLGDTFNMSFDLTNTSTIKDVRNLKVVLDTSSGQSGESVFLPVNKSNSFFVSALGTGEVSQIEIPLKVFANAEGKSYSLEIAFEYEDYDGNLYNDSEIINIPVYEKTELTVSDVRVGTSLETGYTLEVDFFNTGKVDITNMMVDIEGDFVTLNSNYYVGDFTTGRTDVYDVEIEGTRPEALEGRIIFTYDDTFGEEEILIKDFVIGATGAIGTQAKAAGNGRPTGEGNAGGSGRNGQGSFGDMTAEEMEAVRNMSQEERQAFMDNGGSDSAQETSILKNPVALGGIGLLALVVIIAVVFIRRRKARA